jgi:hypothetical protein
MMNVPGFTEEALAEVNDMLDFSINPYAGQCGQKKLREQNRTQRTPQQQAGDQARSQALRGHTSTGNRSAAAKKAAETRKRCRGSG